jgi:hypothetical protein
MAEEGIKGWHIFLILLGIGAIGAIGLYLWTRQTQGQQPSPTPPVTTDGRITVYINVEQGFDKSKYFDDAVLEFYDKNNKLVCKVPITIPTTFSLDINMSKPELLPLLDRYPKVKMVYHNTKTYDVIIVEESWSSEQFRAYKGSFMLYISEWIPRGESATLHLGYDLDIVPDVGTYYTVLRYRIWDYYRNKLLYENTVDMGQNGLHWRKDITFATLGYTRFTVTWEYLDDYNRVLWSVVKEGLVDGDTFVIYISKDKLIKRKPIT